MGESTKIEWAHHTFNPWRGCTKVSPGCQHCYAETLSKRNPAVLGVWGDQGTRVVAAESYWLAPHRWNREAEKAGERRRVFCASLADVFEDRPDLDEPRCRLFDVMAATPWLNWLLLTKRPENVLRLVSRVDVDSIRTGGGRRLAMRWWGGYPPDNIWIGTTTENQEMAEKRIPELLRIPAAVRFLSVEPMLERMDLRQWLPTRNACAMRLAQLQAAGLDAVSARPAIDWVIVGGESGAGARPFDVAWARSIVTQCREAGVACFVKQLGAKPFDSEDARFAGHSIVNAGTILATALALRDPKGGDPAEWPEYLRVRQVPLQTLETD